MNNIYILLFAIFLSVSATGQKPRILVTTDIGGDPDDEESMVRFLLYSNEFDIEGIIATGRVVRDERPILLPELINERIKAFGEVRNNLLLHENGYPTVEYLLDRVKTGYNIPKMIWDPKTGKRTNYPLNEKIGPGKDSEGSQWIIHVVDKPDPRPIWITIWGTSSDLAQALWRVKKERTPEELATFVAKLRVYAIIKQDLTNDWILENFPELFMIQTTGSHMGMYEEGDLSYYSEEWVNKNARQNHGPLGKLYSPRPFKLVYIEGDTPSFLYLIPNGLSDPNHPDWGSWGGRFKSSGSHYVDIGEYTPEGESLSEAKLTVARWRPRFQNDFEARLDWCVEPYNKANHNPVANVNGVADKLPMFVDAKVGDKLVFDASRSSDPDGNHLSFNWYFYDEISSMGCVDKKISTDGQKCTVKIPETFNGRNLHLILEVSDNGRPQLLSYKRIIINII